MKAQKRVKDSLEMVLQYFDKTKSGKIIEQITKLSEANRLLLESRRKVYLLNTEYLP